MNKSTWDYRVCKQTEYGIEGEEIKTYSVRECYYEGDILKGWTHRGIKIDGSDSIEEIKLDIARFMSSFNKPVIDLDIFNTHE
jgi:hypothetical protein